HGPPGAAPAAGSQSPLRRPAGAPRGAGLPARAPAPRRVQGCGVPQRRRLQPPSSLPRSGRRGGRLPAGHHGRPGVLLALRQPRPALHGHGRGRAGARVAAVRDPPRPEPLPRVGEPGPGSLFAEALRGGGPRLPGRARHQSERRLRPRLSRPQPAEPRPRRRGRARAADRGPARPEPHRGAGPSRPARGRRPARLPTGLTSRYGGAPMRPDPADAPRLPAYRALAVTVVTLALAYGVWYAYGVFLVALLREFGWSRSVLAGRFSFSH